MHDSLNKLIDYAIDHRSDLQLPRVIFLHFQVHDSLIRIHHILVPPPLLARILLLLFNWRGSHPSVIPLEVDPRLGNPPLPLVVLPLGPPSVSPTPGDRSDAPPSP